MTGLRRVASLLARSGLCLVLLLGLRKIGGAGVDAQEEEVPYLLFTTSTTIYRLYLNGSSAEEIHRPTNLGISAIDYHYRFNYMFWIDSFPHIMRAQLNGSDVTVLVAGDLSDPVDLAVDWINDKLYWVDRGLRRIEEYDLISGHRKVVASTGNMGQTLPGALALYPYPNSGWLYWSDVMTQSIEMVSVNGENRATFHGGLPQIHAMTVDYTTQTLYWISTSTYEIEAIRLDGDANSHTYPFSNEIFFANGVAVYQNWLFWIEASGVYRADRHVEDEASRMFAISGTRGTALQVVHPSQQPLAEEYVSIVTNASNDLTFSCDSDCVHGNCIFPGLCACNAGWRGGDCSIDKDECSENKGGCSHQCTNSAGSFQCSCPTGYTLSDDQLTCTALNSCEGPSHGCQQRCINQEGSYSCGCNVGYMLNEDGKTCRAIECTTTTVTVTDAPSPTATFDPCLYVLPKTSSSSVSFTSSGIPSVGSPIGTYSTNSTIEISSSRTDTTKITSSSVLSTSINFQRNGSSTIGHISSSSAPSKITSSSVHEHTSIHIQRNTSSTLEHISSTPTIIASSSVDQQTSSRTTSSSIGQSISPSSFAPTKVTSSSLDVDKTTTVIAKTSTLHALRSSEMSASHHVSSTVTSHSADITPTLSYSELPSAVQPDSTRTRSSTSEREEPVVSSTTATREIPTTGEVLKSISSSSQPISSSSVPFHPEVLPPGTDSQKNSKSNNIALMVGAACGAVFVIVVVVGVLVAICICCAHQKRHSGSWSPSPSKSNGTVSPTSMKPIPDTNSSFSAPSKV